MPRIIGTRFVRQNNGREYEYELELDFKDQAIMENHLEIDVVAKRRPLQKGPLFPFLGAAGWERVTATLQYDIPQNRIAVSIAGTEIGYIDIAGITWLPEAFIEEAWQQLSNAFTATAVGRSIEECIQRLPVPLDPVFGCLLKAGISTVAGQSVRCIGETKGVEVLWRRVREIFKCLGHSAPTMLLTAARRTFVCMIMLGFG